MTGNAEEEKEAGTDPPVPSQISWKLRRIVYYTLIMNFYN